MPELDERVRQRIRAIQPPRGPAPEVRYAVLGRISRRHGSRLLMLAPVAVAVVAVALMLARPWAAAPATVEADQTEAIRSVMVNLADPGFQPLAPGYLPAGAHLSEVRVDRQEPVSRVRGIAIQFVGEGGRRIVLQQRPSGEPLPAMSAAGDEVRRVVIHGEPWQLYERPGGQQVVLRRDGDPAVSLEANLPVDELVRIAAALQPSPKPPSSASPRPGR